MMKNRAVRTAPIQGIWSGTISFSLVAIPVQLVRAVEPPVVSFRLLHDKDNSPLERKMFCQKEGSIVPQDEMIRGYEIRPGKNVMITDEELDSVSPERSRTIEITEFIDIDEVDPVYFDHPYYLVPLKGGEKAYQLLTLALKRANKAGIAKFVLDEREYLALIKNRDGALELATLHYHDEVLPDRTSAKSGDRAAEKAKAGLIKIIGEMTGDFEPGRYSDSRRKAFLRILGNKLKRKAAVEAPEIEKEEAAEGMVDLMAALRDSMRKLKKSDEQKKNPKHK